MICNECETVAHCMTHGCIPKQQALNKKAENARKLGLDYEPTQQEPLGKVNELFDESVIEQCGFNRELLVYTAPPAQRTWVGLTEGEVDDLSREMVKGEKSVNWLSYSIEAKLKEKNT